MNVVQMRRTLNRLESQLGACKGDFDLIICSTQEEYDQKVSECNKSKIYVLKLFDFVPTERGKTTSRQEIESHMSSLGLT